MTEIQVIWNDWLLRTIGAFLDFHDETCYKLIGCWIIGSHMFEDFDAFPYLYFCGTKQSGKSKALTLLQKLCPRAELSATASVPAIFRAADKWKSTLLFDELEQLTGEDKSELRSLLYSGYKHGGYALRCPRDSKIEEPLRFSVYCPKAICSINRPDDVMADRCVLINMRRTLHRNVANLSIPTESWKLGDSLVTWTGLRELIAKAVGSDLQKIKTIYNELTDEEIVGRAWELWKPVLSVAKVVGEDAYTSLREYAIKCIRTTKEEDAESLECNLIEILAGRFRQSEKPTISISSSDLLYEVNKVPEWSLVRARKMGVTMRNLGFPPQHTNEGNQYVITKTKLLDIADRLSVDISGIVKEVSDVNSPEGHTPKPDNLKVYVNEGGTPQGASLPSQGSEHCWVCKTKPATTEVPDIWNPKGGNIQLCEECKESKV